MSTSSSKQPCPKCGGPATSLYDLSAGSREVWCNDDACGYYETRFDCAPGSPAERNKMLEDAGITWQDAKGE
jgi:hypothetical protein